MKIGTYVAILIAACLVGGYFIEFVLSGQFNSFNQASTRHNDNRLWLKDFERVVSDSNQYLISVDLIIASGQTYLAQGAKNKGQLIATELRVLESKPQSLFTNPSLAKLSNDVLGINELIEKTELVNAEGREEKLSILLNQYDPIAFKLSSELAQLKQQFQSTLSVNLKQLEIVKAESEQLTIITRVVYSLFLMGLWYWASRKISSPLQDLTNMAQSAEKGGQFEGVNRGPREIRQLSKNMEDMTNSLSYQARHDPLTQLLNRRAFDLQLHSEVQKTISISNSVTHALCFIDLDRFKAINDTCGHAAGDELLQNVANLLKKMVRSSDVVARLGGDEFAILLVNCDIKTAEEICNKIRHAIRELKYFRDHHVFQISASMGLTLVNGDNDSLFDLLNAADTACKYVKESGRDSVHVFYVDDAHLQRKRGEVSLISQINRAIEENSFVLCKQDIVPLSANAKGLNYEILIRMRSEQGELLYPDAFLPLAERYDLCHKIDECVVNTVIDYLFESPAELEQLEMCSINLSGQTIGSQEFLGFILTKLDTTQFPANKLCFEITETSAITHLDTATDLINRLREYGCRVALDDFGSGLSSFTYLKTLPVDIIKIDGSFVRDIVDDHVSYVTVKSLTEVASALGKKTIAEFVENKAILEALEHVGIDYAQGYYFDRPSVFIDPH
jgi:diguanylate cyclase (GGDEF)-like protein